jgi:short-subunit dehydrogenase
LALITGASSGLGAEFARQLAGQGYALILVARRQERLEALAAELQERYGVPVEVLTADLAQPQHLRRLEKYVEGLGSLDLLVNNAGFGTHGRFFKVPAEKHLAMVDVHLKASMCLSRAALPGMIARGRGAIINVASLAAFFPWPRNVTYNATKAALVAFSETLALELRGTGVKVQALCPGFTHTEFHDTPEYQGFDRSQIPALMWGKAPQVVTRSLKALEKGQVVCVPRGLDRFLAFFGRNHVFRPLVRLVIRWMFMR